MAKVELKEFESKDFTLDVKDKDIAEDENPEKKFQRIPLDVEEELKHDSKEEKMAKEKEKAEQKNIKNEMFKIIQEYQQKRIEEKKDILKFESISDIVHFYHLSIKDLTIVSSIPPDIKYLIYCIKDEEIRALVFIWYYYMQHIFTYYARNQERGIPSLTEFARKYTLKLFRKKEERFKDKTDFAIVSQLKKEYEYFYQTNSNDLEVTNTNLLKAHIQIAIVEAYRDAGEEDAVSFENGDRNGEIEGDTGECIRLHFLMNYQSFLQELNVKLQRYIPKENEEFGVPISTTKTSFKLSQKEYDKIEATAKNLIENLFVDGDKKENIYQTAKLVLEEQAKAKLEGKGIKMSVEEYKEKAKANTKQWREKHSEKVKEYNKKSNVKNMEKYHDDEKYRYKILKAKYVSLIQGGYIQKPKTKTLNMYGIDASDGKYTVDANNDGPNISFPKETKRRIREKKE